MRDRSVDRAVAEIDALSGEDPEVAHDMADAVVLRNVDPRIADAYWRLVKRARWWATA